MIDGFHGTALRSNRTLSSLTSARAMMAAFGHVLRLRPPPHSATFSPYSSAAFACGASAR
eukprot:151961-Pleurochrysis_carterae.AAC.3